MKGKKEQAKKRDLIKNLNKTKDYLFIYLLSKLAVVCVSELLKLLQRLYFSVCTILS